MTDQEPQGSTTEDSPRGRVYQLLRILSSSLATGLLIMLLSSSVLDLLHRVSTVPTVVIRQLQSDAYIQMQGALEQSTNNLASLEKLVADNPEAAVLVAKIKTDIGNVQTTLNQAPSVELSSISPISFDVFSVANAQEAEPSVEKAQDNTIVYSLLGLVAFMMVAFCLLYIFTQDKAKKTFAEKTLTNMIGFVFGLLTGYMSGKLK